MNKKHVIAASILAGTVALTGVYGAGVAKAAGPTDSLPPMIQRLAEKFNLNQDEVKTFVNQDRENHQAEMQAQRKTDFTAKLDELVTAGKITADQKTQIVAKHDELETKRDAVRDNTSLSKEDRRTQMQAIGTEMEDFLKSIGVDESLIQMGRGMKGGMGQGFKGGEGRSMGMHRGFNQ